MVHLAVVFVALAGGGPTPPISITPAAASAAPGQAVTFRLERAGPGEADIPAPIPWGSVPMDVVLLRAANTQTNADAITELLPPGDPGRGAAAPQVAVPLTHPGTNLLAVNVRPWMERIDAADLRVYLEGRISAEAMARVDAAIPARGEIAVQRIEAAKAFIEVRPLDGPDAATAASKTGQPAEIRLLMNPAALEPGSELPVRVYAAGEAREGAVVRLRAEAGPGLPAAAASCTTDSVGIGFLPLERAGLYHLEFVHAGPAGAPHAGADVVLYTATATFYVYEGGRAPEPPAAKGLRP